MCWGNGRKERREKRHAASPKPTPTNKTRKFLEERGKACARTRNKQIHTALTTLPEKTKQNRTGPKLNVNWYNQRINATLVR